MKHRFLFLAALPALILHSCKTAPETDVQENGLKPGTVCFTLPQPQMEAGPALTKTHSADDGTLVWSKTDTIGIFPDEGSQIYYSMEKGEGEKTAIFDGGGWGLKPNTTYWSYYPFYSDIYLKGSRIPYKVTGQIQKENGVRVHDGYDCLFAKATSTSGKAISFNYERLCCFLHFTLSSISGTFTRIILSSDEAIFPVSGYFDIKDEKVVLCADEYAGYLAMDLGNIAVNKGENLDLYMAFFPCDLTKSTFTIMVEDTDGKMYSFEKTAKVPYEKGKVYKISSTELVQDPEAFLLTRDSYGLYELSSMTPVCTYIQGTDMYSVFSELDDRTFRIMNYSLNDSEYKFLSVRFRRTQSASGYDKAYIYAPDLTEYSGKEYDIELLHKAEDGTCRFKDSTGEIGIIAKLED